MNFKSDGLRNFGGSNVFSCALVTALVFLLSFVDDQISGFVDLDSFGRSQVDVVAVLLPLDQRFGVAFGRRTFENDVFTQNRVRVLRHRAKLIPHI